MLSDDLRINYSHDMRENNRNAATRRNVWSWVYCYPNPGSLYYLYECNEQTEHVRCENTPRLVGVLSVTRMTINNLIRFEICFQLFHSIESLPQLTANKLSIQIASS